MGIIIEPKPGTYALVLSCRTNARIQVGRLGTMQLQRGYYVYLGSALGSGGLRARLAHHQKLSTRPHWHIDHLRAHTRLHSVWLSYGGIRLEHEWARAIVKVKDATIPVPGYLDDRHQRVFGTVSLYADPIIKALQEEEAKPDVQFVVIPDEVRKYCRHEAVIDPDVRVEALRQLSTVRQAKSLYREPSLFVDQNIAAEPYFYKEHFHNQLKAKLLPHKVSTQVLREGTLENINTYGDTAAEKALIKMQSAITWNIGTTAFYKAGGRPWKVSGIRDGVCYIGLVYKKDDRAGDNGIACCGAQMFLDLGDGLVFK